ncbi:flagellar biosynthesis regulator FlaF [Hyphomicrobium sp.]|uniref:flagellar biosynthesis regulator FlaF n=1 Tax=Hyphomicrobium sp. TaxID=82 RepID=UPI0025BA8482|nr:flagellar biosynthesis regulator FlaF [Hyphomicrobium sp.]MCC7253304.1 flagellar biosynthesis regulator FlaF [Hyphomicrobium sp.]
MYKFYYDEVLDESPKEARAQERTALERSIALLQEAENKGPQSREAIEAIFFVRRLWGVFIEDLAKSENGLPPKLRADLVSIGLWVMRETEEIRQGRSKNFTALIDVSRTISEGLG